MIKAGIVGATGYAGAELVRLLSAHPEAEIAAVSSVSFEGQKLSDVYPAYAFLNDMICENQAAVVEKSDVIFAALPHGLSQELAAQCMAAGKAFIDLGADFRLESEDAYTEWYGGTFLDKELHAQSVYGLPEFFRDKIKGKRLIANPGCYTTCSPLAIAPAIVNGLVSTKGIICDCKSGVTGAGRKPTQGNHFPELNEGFHAYKVACHRHTPEIEQTLSKLSGEDVTITFVPHLLPVNRGILATVYADVKDGVTFADIRKAYEDYYKDEFFVRLLDDDKCADIHNVRYSNFCDISIHHDARAGKLVACAAIHRPDHRPPRLLAAAAVGSAPLETFSLETTSINGASDRCHILTLPYTSVSPYYLYIVMQPLLHNSTTYFPLCVGANPCVRPSRVALSSGMIRGKRRFPTRAHTQVRPYTWITRSTPSFHII